jgi:hypothetical protein
MAGVNQPGITLSKNMYTRKIIFRTCFSLCLLFASLHCFSQVAINSENSSDTSKKVRSKFFDSYVSEKKVNEAKQLLAEGQYQKCCEILNEVLSFGSLSKRKKEKLLEILITAHLELDDLIAADKCYKKLLINNPDYSIENYSGIDEFGRLLKNYYAYPSTSISIHLNSIHPYFYSTKIYSVLTNTNYDTDYRSDLQTNFALRFEKKIKERISIFFTAGTNNISYSRTISNIINNNFYNSPAEWKLTVNEKFNYLSFQPGVNLHFRTSKKLNFHLGTRLGANYLYSNSLSLREINKKPADAFSYEIIETQKRLDDYSFMIARKKTLLSAGLTAGTAVRVGNWFAHFELSGDYFINSVNVKHNRFTDDRLIEEFDYIDNDFKVVNFGASFGIGRYLVFKVKKIK